VIGNDRKINGIKDGTVLNCKESIEALLVGQLFGYVWDKLFDRSVLQNNRFKEGMNYEDAPFTYEAFFKAAAVAVCGRTLYHYRVREESITCVGSEKNYTDYVKSMELVEEIVKTNYSEGSKPEKLLLLRHLWTLYAIQIALSRIKADNSLIKGKIRQKRQLLFNEYYKNLRYFASVNHKEAIRFVMVTLTPWLIYGYFCAKGAREHWLLSLKDTKRKRNES